MAFSRDLTYPLADNALCYWSLGILLLLFIKERKTIHLLLFTIYSEHQFGVIGWPIGIKKRRIHQMRLCIVPVYSYIYTMSI